MWTNGVTPENPTGATVSGFGNVLGQAWIVHDLDQRWAVALGGQLIAPTATNGVATDAWEQVTGLVVRAMLPEISPGSYFAPQVRYGIDFEGNDDGRLLRQLRIAPTLNINLPHNLFFTLYPSPDIRLNYGAPVWNQTGRLFLPLNFMVGWKPTDHTVISAEFGIPIIKDFPVYTFKNSIESGLSVLIPAPSIRRSEALSTRPRPDSHGARPNCGGQNSLRASGRALCNVPSELTYAFVKASCERPLLAHLDVRRRDIRRSI